MRIVYLISFSKDGGDRLSQWRAYGGGSGVAIGFDTEEMRKKCSTITLVRPDKVVHTPATLPSSRLTEVKYVDPLRDQVSNQTIAAIDAIYGNPLLDPLTGSSVSREQTFSRLVSVLSANLKHVAFREEAEWRVIIFDPTHNLQVRFRTRKSMMVPYVPFNLGDVDAVWPLISRIVVGPSPHQAEAIAAIKKMLDERVVVVGSSIPYRDW